MNPRNFIQSSYDRNNSWAIDIASNFFRNKGFQIIDSNEDYNIDFSIKNNLGYRFGIEVEVKTGYPFTCESDFPFDTVSFLGRKEKWKDLNFFYMIICKETKISVVCNSLYIFQEKFREKIYIDSYERKGYDTLYRVPKKDCLFINLSPN